MPEAIEVEGDHARGCILHRMDCREYGWPVDPRGPELLESVAVSTAAKLREIWGSSSRQ
jgi:hypothetical protein